MSPINEQILQSPRGGIVYDASRLRKPAHELFEREHWAARNALTEIAGGRGSVCFLRAEQGRWVLRHYRRGGLIGRILRDEYLWLGEHRTRSFAEWRLLAELRRYDLPVPAPIAARYVRSGLVYRADLITEELPGTRTLASILSGPAEPLTADCWRQIGSTVARFHRRGVHHADLNAHNILLGNDDAVYMLDFDRGCIRSRGAWEERVLARLKRSIEKVSAKSQDSGAASVERQWIWLLEGYRAAAIDERTSPPR